MQYQHLKELSANDLTEATEVIRQAEQEYSDWSKPFTSSIERKTRRFKAEDGKITTDHNAKVYTGIQKLHTAETQITLSNYQANINRLKQQFLTLKSYHGLKAVAAKLPKPFQALALECADLRLSIDQNKELIQLHHLSAQELLKNSARLQEKIDEARRSGESATVFPLSEKQRANDKKSYEISMKIKSCQQKIREATELQKEKQRELTKLLRVHLAPSLKKLSQAKKLLDEVDQAYQAEVRNVGRFGHVHKVSLKKEISLLSGEIERLNKFIERQ
ncbi:MAG: hypothetical protein AAF944_04650 [Bacteroidota bacterium]